MLSLNVLFSPYEIYDLDDPEMKTVRRVNHSMFYVFDNEENTMHRIHCTPDADGQYYVDCAKVEYLAPRNCAGEGFEIRLTTSASGLAGIEFAHMLAELSPPRSSKGGCQWWILKNLTKFEASGHVESGSMMMLLKDDRMDSNILMEFQGLRDELRRSISTTEPDTHNTPNVESSLQLAFPLERINEVSDLSDPVRSRPENGPSRARRSLLFN